MREPRGRRAGDRGEEGHSLGLENGTNDMSWNLTDLAANQTYTFEWRVRLNNDYVPTRRRPGARADPVARFNWTLDIDTSTTCNIYIDTRTFSTHRALMMSGCRWTTSTTTSFSR